MTDAVTDAVAYVSIRTRMLVTDAVTDAETDAPDSSSRWTTGPKHAFALTKAAERSNPTN